MSSLFTELTSQLHALKLPTMAESFSEIALKAARNGLSHEAYLHELVRLEGEAREQRRRARFHNSLLRALEPSNFSQSYGGLMSASTSTEIDLNLTPAAAVEVKKFMDAEGVTGELGGLRVAVQPGGCSGFKYSLVIEDKSAEDDFVLDNDGFKVFVDPFSAQYISGVTIDYVSSMQGSGFTFKNPNSTGGCGCGSSFTA